MTSRLPAALFAAGLFLAACGTDAATTANAGQIETTESTFPQLTVPTVAGGQFEFGSLEGQDTVLWFWAPW